MNKTGKISEALQLAIQTINLVNTENGVPYDELEQIRAALPLAEQLEAEVVSLRAELEQANKRIETLRQESQSHADTIREMVPSYMKYWAPLSAVEILCKEQEKLRAELEQERIQHAGCLTAAEGWAKDPPKKGDWAWSPAFQAALDLRAQVEQLTADKARLDWLEERHFDLIYTTTLMLPRWCLGADESYFEVEGKTPREAIDAAMKESQ